jgi:hypothetical protein
MMALSPQHDYEKMYRRYLEERNLADPLEPQVGNIPKAPGIWSNALNDTVAAQDFVELQAKHNALETKYEELLKTAFYLESRIRNLEETNQLRNEPVIMVDPAQDFNLEDVIDD